MPSKRPTSSMAIRTDLFKGSLLRVRGGQVICAAGWPRREQGACPPFRRLRHAPVSVTADFVVALRNTMNTSRAVFARMLHVPARTVERWEQGRGAISGPAALLMMLAAKYPDTLKRIERAVEEGPNRAEA